jgi:hypothetical protein
MHTFKSQESNSTSELKSQDLIDVKRKQREALRPNRKH